MNRGRDTQQFIAVAGDGFDRTLLRSAGASVIVQARLKRGARLGFRSACRIGYGRTSPRA
jgi:hypothetical protein